MRLRPSFCSPSNCKDGSGPEPGLIQDPSGNFYGTTNWGGAGAVGTVFELRASGKENVLYSFTGRKGGPNPYPYDGVVRDSHGNLFGVTWQGGGSGCGGWGCGVVYEITATGEEKTLYRFTGGADGGNPSSGLVLGSDGNLYGTTYYGGDLSCYDGYNYGCGTVFKITP